MKNKLFSLFLMLTISVGTIFAEKVQIGALYYNLDATNKTAEVTSQNSSNPYWSTNISAANIPSSVTYNSEIYSVTCIGEEAFCECNSLISIEIPNSVTSIGSYAFFRCTGLTSIEIPNSVTSIDASSFSNCSSLTSIVIPNSVTSIGKSAFTYCSGLTSVVISNNIVSIGDNVFAGCSGLTSIEIPNSVTSIGDYAFAYCTGLTSIEIPNSVTNIGESAFRNCSGLTSIEIPNSVTSIGKGAFSGCSGLTTIEIPNSVTSIRSYAFGSCTSLTSVTIPNGVTSIGSYAFGSCTSLTSVTIPNSITVMEKNVFNNCSNLKKVTLNSNAIVSRSTYSSSLNIGTLFGVQVPEYIIGDSVTSIGKCAFDYCTGLTSVTIPNSVSSIGQSAFSGCSGLTTIEIPNSIVNIGNNAFSGCSGLTFLEIPNGVTSIGSYVFSGCNSLTSIEIPNSVTSIGNRAFSGCSGLTSIEIPNSVSSIGQSAFNQCTSLTSVTIPNSVISIGDGAFLNCTNLNYFYIDNDTPPTLASSTVFQSDVPIYVPCGSIDTYTSAENWISYVDMIKYEPLGHSLQVLVKDSIGGDVAFPMNVCEELSIEALADYGYHFTQWSDGIKDNPRMIELTQDTTFIAEFGIDKSGTCGENDALTWLYNDQSKTMTITGNGALTDKYTFGVEAPTQMNTLIIGDSVTAIGDSAFYGKNSIYHLFIGANAASIGNYAFAECRNFDDITCYATIVPTINSTTFANVGNKQYIYLFVPEDRERAYKRDTWWGQFDIRIKGTEATTTSTNSVTVDPSDNTALFTWPIDDDAASYSLQITKDGVVFCTLIFNSNGQLTGIAFAPSRNGVAHAQAATMSVSAMSFTVTGLNSASKYAYRLSVTDESQNEIQVYSGEFATIGYEGDVNPGGEPEINTEGIEDVLSTEKVNKILRDGQILILRGDKTYTLTGQEVR